MEENGEHFEDEMNKILSNHSSTEMLFPRLSNELNRLTSGNSNKELELKEVDQAEVDENIKRIRELEKDEKMNSF